MSYVHVRRRASPRYADRAPLSSRHSAGIAICAETCACSLALTGRSDAAVLGFVPDVIFSADSTTNRAAVISDAAAGIGLVLDFWY
jgi:hypothetical protein